MALDDDGIRAAIAGLGVEPARPVGRFWIAAGPDDRAVHERPVLVLDRFGEPVAEGRGGFLTLEGDDIAQRAASLVAACTRRRGPVTTPPTTWVVQGNRAAQVPPADITRAVAAARDGDDLAALVALCG